MYYELISGTFCLVIASIAYFACLGSKLTPTVFDFSRKNYSTNFKNFEFYRTVTKFVTNSPKEIFSLYPCSSEWTKICLWGQNWPHSVVAGLSFTSAAILYNLSSKCMIEFLRKLDVFCTFSRSHSKKYKKTVGVCRVDY